MCLLYILSVSNNSNSVNIVHSSSLNIDWSKIRKSTNVQLTAILTKVWMSIPIFAPTIVKITFSHNACSTTMQITKSKSTFASQTCFTLWEIRSLNSHKYLRALAMSRRFNNSSVLACRSNLPGKMCLSKKFRILLKLVKVAFIKLIMQIQC